MSPAALPDPTPAGLAAARELARHVAGTVDHAAGPLALLHRRLDLPRRARRRAGRRARSTTWRRRGGGRAARRAACVRGAATSLAGQTLGPGIVVDCFHLDRIVASTRTAHRRVEPGVIQASLNAAAAPYGLEFGPDTSTVDQATIGGMVGNNSSGSRSIVYGETIDKLAARARQSWPRRRRPCSGCRDGDDLASGLTACAAARSPSGSRRCASARDAHRRRLPPDPPPRLRLQPARLLQPQPNLARLLAGSEGTLALFAETHGASSTGPRTRRAGGGLTFPSLRAALEANLAILDTGPSAVELTRPGAAARLAEPAPVHEPGRRSSTATTAACCWSSTRAARRDAGRPGRGCARSSPSSARPSSLPFADPAERGRGLAAAPRRAAAADGRARRASGRPRSSKTPPWPPSGWPTSSTTSSGRRRARRPRFVHRPRLGRLHARAAAARPEDGRRRRPPQGDRLWPSAVSSRSTTAPSRASTATASRVRGSTPSCSVPRLYAELVALKDAVRPAALARPRHAWSRRRRSTTTCGSAPATSTGPLGAVDRPRLGVRGAEGGFDLAVERCFGAGLCKKLTGSMCPTAMVGRDETLTTRARANALQAIVAGAVPLAALGARGVRGGDGHLPRLQGLQDRVSRRGRHGRAQGRVAGRGARARACRCWRARSPTSAAAVRLAAPMAPAVNALGRDGRWPAPSCAAGRRRPPRARCRRSPPGRSPGAPAPRGSPRRRRASSLFADCFIQYQEPHDRRGLRAAARGGRPAASPSSTPAAAGARCCRSGMLDKARRRRAAAGRRAGRRRPGRPRYRLRRAELPVDGRRRLAAAAARRRRVAEVAAAGRARRCRWSPTRRRTAACASRPAARRCSIRTATSGPLFASAETERALRAVPGLDLEVLDAGCCGMSGVFGYEADALRAQRRHRRAGPAAGGAGGGARGRRAGDRHLVPVADRRPRRPPRPASARVPGRAAALIATRSAWRRPAPTPAAALGSRPDRGRRGVGSSDSARADENRLRRWTSQRADKALVEQP